MLPIFEKINLSESLSSIKVFQRKEPYFESNWHFHPEMELTYIEKGEGLRYVGDSIERFSAGDLVLLGKNIPHNWESLSKNNGQDDEALVIQFSENIFNLYPEFSSFQPLINASKLGLRFKPKSNFLNKIKGLYSEDRVMSLLLFFEVLHTLNFQSEVRSLSSESFSFPKYNHMETQINKVKKYIDAHISGNLGLNDVSHHMKMTESYFCRWFKKSTGNTFIQYVNKLRIELVCRELITTDKNISVIAYKMGFENISHFNRVFKQIKNCSPGRYRKLQAQGIV